MENDPIHKRIADYVAQHEGCTFVGISSDKEVFLSFNHEDDSLQYQIKVSVKKHFGDEVEDITTIVSISMEEITTLVDGLNKALEETPQEEPPQPQLLEIEPF